MKSKFSIIPIFLWLPRSCSIIFLFSLLLSSKNSRADTAADGVISQIHGRVVDVEELPRFSEPQQWLAPQIQENRSRYLSGDMNGDGRSDLLRVIYDQYRLELFLSHTENSFSKISIKRPDTSWALLEFADVNADRCADVYLWNEQKHLLDIGISNCKDDFSWEPSIQVTTDINFSSAIVERPAPDHSWSLLLMAPAPDHRIFRLQNNSLEEHPHLSLKSIRLPPKQLGQSFIVDVDADGTLDRVFGTKASSGSFWQMNGRTSQIKKFASLPEELGPTALTPLDLNGDRKVDFLSFATFRPHYGWMAIISSWESALELDIPAPIPPSWHFESLLPGDFNGDGFADLSWIQQSHGKAAVWVAHRLPPQGISDVEIIMNPEGMSTKTDSSGRFVIERIPSKTEQIPWRKLEFFKPGYLFSSKEREFRTDLPIPIIEAAENISGPEHPIGRSIGLLGDPPGPYICLGYDSSATMPDSSSSQGLDFSPFLRWTRSPVSCPKGYAIFNIDRVHRSWTGEITRPITGTCCRLPADDILGEEQHYYTTTTCPEDFVITGFGRANGQHYEALCTKLNVGRYQLGKVSNSIYWGFSRAMRKESARIPLFQIPNALKPGLLRNGFYSQSAGGCLSGVNGELFIGLNGERCDEHPVRALQYRGIRGDPPAGTRVPIFPNCRLINEVSNPLAGCPRE